MVGLDAERNTVPKMEEHHANKVFNIRGQFFLEQGKKERKKERNMAIPLAILLNEC